jgi:DNA mismatch repair protein MutL
VNGTAATSRIRVLPPALANQIAAGEVIERPASVIKELVENSLDAGATQIEIDVRGGGVEAIRVTDNGHGIHPDDVPLAFDRHATSKVSSAADLEAIRTLGFRGEALPSIAAVARVRLTSCLRGAEHGVLVEFDPLTGRRDCRPAAHPPGTTVEVNDLFCNVPARRKFLRAPRTEFLHILDMVRRLALGRSDCTIRLRHDGTPVLTGTGAGTARIDAIIGRSFLRRTLPVEAAAGSMRITGRVSGRDAHRSQPDQQFFFLNGRMIRDRQVAHAVRIAYGDLLPPGRFPLYLLYLELDPHAADVNVHPTKHEVRFRDSRDVHDFIAAAVRTALEGPVPAEPPEDRSFAPVREAPFPVYGVTPAAGPAEAGHGPQLGEPLGHLDGRYILSARDGGWLVVDAHAAMRVRVRQEVEAALAAGEALAPRPLLVPLQVQAGPAEIDALDSAREDLARFGTVLQAVGPAQVMIRALPAILEEADAVPLARDVLAALAKSKDRAAAIADLLPAHVPARPCAGADLSRLRRFLRSLEAGFDCARPYVPGIWRTLDEAALVRLLGKDGTEN